jgi:serine/threonine-protein kinase HipA
MNDLPARIRHLSVTLNRQPCGSLTQESQLVFKYGRDDLTQPSVGLLMPPSKIVYSSNTLFPVMDQNIPEGYLMAQMRAMFPKQPLTVMHFLALMGENGIGRLGFSMEGAQTRPLPAPLSKADVLKMPYRPETFDALVREYLMSGFGIAGMQPKIMLPVQPDVALDRATIPIPRLIVKAGSPAYPGIAANEFLCLTAAEKAGILTPAFDLSHDGQLLVLDRFDIADDGRRLGFEDIAALMGLSVRDTLSDRKYQGSYEQVAEALRLVGLGPEDLARFFEQVAFTIMVRNGDGHLKNYGVLYEEAPRAGKDRPEMKVRLAPMFDVLTTSIYKYERWSGGDLVEDKTLALKLRRGKNGSRVYPTKKELHAFASEVCGARKPKPVLERIAEAMKNTLIQARQDERIPARLLDQIGPVWLDGCTYAD